MADIEPPEPGPPRQAGILDILPSKEFATSRKGTLLIAEVVLSLIIFICFVVSTDSSFVTAPLVEFLFAFVLLFAYSAKLNERLQGFHWPLMDFLRCVSAAIIYFIISIIVISKSRHSASQAGGAFGFIATIVFAFDFYFIYNELIGFVRQGQQSTEERTTSR